MNVLKIIDDVLFIGTMHPDSQAYNLKFWLLLSLICFAIIFMIVEILYHIVVYVKHSI